MPKLSQKTIDLIERVGKIEERVIKLESEFALVEKKLTKEPEKPVEKAPEVKKGQPIEQQGQPVPLEWQRIVETLLNKKFSPSVVYRPDARFELTILVPKEYSNASSSVWEMDKADRRIRVIDNAMGEAGVTDFVEKIATNLGVETMRKVEDDRTK